MAVAILILIGALIIGLNIAFGKRFRASEKSPSKAKVTLAEEEFTEPVSRTYRILFWYALYHCSKIVVTLLWTLIFTRPWQRYTAQYLSTHYIHASVPFLKLQDIVVFISEYAFFFAVYAYLLKSKDKKVIIMTMKWLVALNGFSLLFSLAKPSLYTSYAILASAFDVLVLWCLLKREPNLLKLFRIKQASKGQKA